MVRHGETEWSRSGAHTSFTDLPLTDEGRRRAEAIGEALRGRRFALVLTSPLARARETCELAGFGGQAQIEPNLAEWNYGDYEGRTTADIRKERPGWSLWRDGAPNGEPVAHAGERADAVIARCDGDTLLFAHGHLLRIMAARWLGLPADAGRLFALGTGTISVLGHEREIRVIDRWNLDPAGL